MKLTGTEIRHFKNVRWGTRFHRWARWVFAATLACVALGHFSGWHVIERVDWLIAAGVYLLVAWPGVCRVYVFHKLHRLVAEDSEARSQLAAAGLKEFQSDVSRGRS